MPCSRRDAPVEKLTSPSSLYSHPNTRPHTYTHPQPDHAASTPSHTRSAPIQAHPLHIRITRPPTHSDERAVRSLLLYCHSCLPKTRLTEPRGSEAALSKPPSLATDPDRETNGHAIDAMLLPLSTL